jgi:hypothetical protein
MGREGTEMAETLTFSCGDCEFEGTDACADCVVSFVLDREPGDAIVIDVEEIRAVRLLSDAGLVPSLRHRRRVG